MILDKLGNIGSVFGGTGSWHEFIRIGDKIFDNMRPNGVPAAEFWKDIGGYDLWKNLSDGHFGRWSELPF